MSPFLAGFLASALGTAVVSLAATYLRRRYPLPEPYPDALPLTVPRPRQLKVASLFMLLSSSSAYLSLFACALAFAHILSSMATALILIAIAVVCGLFYIAASLSLKCPRCGVGLLLDTLQPGPFAEKRMLLTAGNVVAISVLREGTLRCMQCGQALRL
jgi:hypothetical protein